MKHPSLFDSTAFYRVPAIEMLRSEARWYIYVNEGIAYTEQTHLRAVILYQYKSRLRSRIQVGIIKFCASPLFPAKTTFLSYIIDTLVFFYFRD